MSYDSSEEKFQEIKEFLAKTWKIIVAVILIGLLSVWGWRYWQSYQQEKLVQSSDKYEQLIGELDNKNPSSIDNLTKFANEDSSIYGVFANLQLAKLYVEESKNYSEALNILNKARDKTDSSPLLAIIEIRIARIQYQLEDYTNSLATLDKITEQDWLSMVNDLRGDIYTKTLRYADAYNAYNTALKSATTPSLESTIRMKLNQIEYLQATQNTETMQNSDSSSNKQ